jgi:hypothetical protein
VLPCHRYPFRGLQARTRTILSHHLSRCGAIVDSCRGNALTCFELVPTIFGRRIEDGVMDLAVGEALAHINFLCARGDLLSVERNGTLAYQAA